ncbi:spore germination protein [Neobacillus notoginsengisoli]|uniref:Spore germination protein n=1 Tax=Neobacillus notoginsengisoli TaxID=1578198 RepID=A0A417YWQ0_9BACI|nr:spore germination protein [Neobacillus notoginsengisoli]RHW41698.1 spore germination protein [Neobacillus notoginsengisoli]
MFKWKRNPSENKEKEKQLDEILQAAKKSSDFIEFSPLENGRMTISCYKTLIDEKMLRRSLLSGIQENAENIRNLTDIKNYVPIEDITVTDDAADAEIKLHTGFALIQMDKGKKCALVSLSDSAKGIRQNNETDNEFSVIGPKVGFIENLDTNLQLLRKQLVTTDLIVEEFVVGNLSKTRVVLAYLNGLTNPEYIQTARQRIEDVDFDILQDTTILEQLLSDHNLTPFPLFLPSERVDKAAYSLALGQIVIFCDGSCYAISAPVSVLDFYNSPEDYYTSWLQGSFFRMIRFFGTTFSVFSTPIYVAVLTYHYEIIPNNLLGPIIYSRANVPFAPYLEVLFLEITIELLREAGARLPSKIGQTLGIVGGIVIGQATVQAALTSNILLIIVALAALSSFTTPIYKMSNTVRLLRFPMILLAAIWGGYGLAVGIVLLMTHLFRLTSLGSPYMVPLYPFRMAGTADTFIKSPYAKSSSRPGYLRVLGRKKYSPKENKDRRKDLNTE